jgi:hypothetical protein
MPCHTGGVEVEVQQPLLRGCGVSFPGYGDGVVGPQEDPEQYQEKLVLLVQRDEVAGDRRLADAH